MTGLPYQAQTIIGRREMVTLPELGLTLCAKADTGARTSSLHAEDIESFEEHGQPWISFMTYGSEPHAPLRPQKLRLHDQRRVTSSNGHVQWRYVVRTVMQLGPLDYMIELTLTNRSNMRHPMLLGRSAMHQLLVAPSETFLHGAP